MQVVAMKNEFGGFIKPMPFVIEPADVDCVTDGWPHYVKERILRFLDKILDVPCDNEKDLGSPYQGGPEKEVIDSLNESIWGLRDLYFSDLGNNRGAYGACIDLKSGNWDYLDPPKREEPVQEHKEEEPKKEPTQDSPKETPEEHEVLPETMPALWKALGISGRCHSKYDFGVNTVSHPRKTPSLQGSLKAFEKVVILAIARALVARKYGYEYGPDSVKESAQNSFRRLARFSGYRDVIDGHPEASAEISGILSQVDRFISGRMDVQATYMVRWVSQRWCIEAFLRYMGKAKLVTFHAVKKDD